jgi:hypothetical protein
MNEVQKTKFWLWLARRMPKKLIYWCAIVMIAQATSGENSKVEVSSLTAMTTLKNWDEKYHINSKMRFK